MASLFGLSNLIYHPKLPVFQNSLHTRCLHPYYRPLKRRVTQYRSLRISFALTESNSPDSSLGQDIQPLLQDISESFVLPPDYFAQLPNDLRLDLNDAAFDISCGPVIDECGQEMGEALLNLSRAWEVADTSTSNDIARKLPALASLLKGNAKSAFGKRLISSGRRFQSMGQYGQGELQRIAKAMIKAGQLLSASAVTSASDEEPKTERMLKFGNLQVELTATKANIGAAIAFVFGIICWQLSQGIQSTPENSLQYANDNALLLGKVLFWMLGCHYIDILGYLNAVVERSAACTLLFIYNLVRVFYHRAHFTSKTAKVGKKMNKFLFKNYYDSALLFESVKL